MTKPTNHLPPGQATPLFDTLTSANASDCTVLHSVERTGEQEGELTIADLAEQIYRETCVHLGIGHNMEAVLLRAIDKDRLAVNIAADLLLIELEEREDEYLPSDDDSPLLGLARVGAQYLMNEVAHRQALRADGA